MGAAARVAASLFVAALLLRVLLLWTLQGQPLSIVDEQHYQGLAERLLEQGAYLSPTGAPTAIRPPLYPFYLATIYRVAGSFDPAPVRAVQVLLGLALGLAAYRWSRCFLGERDALLSLGVALFYPSLLFYDALLLTEVVFSLLLVLAVGGVTRYLESLDVRLAVAAGFALALAALTRSIAYPLAVPLACLFVALSPGRRLRAARGAAAFLLAFACTLAPWAYRNHLTFGRAVPVDTMGGLNLYMGNFEHTPLHRAWAAVDNPPGLSWYAGHEQELAGLNEAQKDKWASARALAYVKTHPGQTALRTVIKAANFWGLEREILAGLRDGFFPALRSRPVQIGLGAAILFTYAAVALAGFCGLGWRLAAAREPVDVVVAFLLVAFTGAHALVFGHSRYHLPLIPLLGAYAAWAVTRWRAVRAGHPRAFGAVLSLVALLLGSAWAYDVLVGSREKIVGLLQGLFG